MDKQIIAIIAVVAIILTAGMVLLLTQSGDGGDGSYQIISRVNTGGSGIYIDKEIVDRFQKSDSNSILNNKAWGGLIMGTPGVSSIQHTQLHKIAKESGLNFKKYNEGEKLNSDTLYYIPDLNEYNKIINNETIDGGIIWESVYQRVIQGGTGYEELVLTDKLFEGHTCCVVVANREWLDNDRDTAIRFLKGYIEGVNFINDEKNSDEVIEIAKHLTRIKEDNIVREAINNVDYKFDDNGKGDLSELTEDIKKFSSELCGMKLIPESKLSNIMGKKGFVDDSFIKEALREDVGNTNSPTNVDVSLSVIDGDIHHLAAYVSYEKDYFEKYGLKVSFKKCDSGVRVATMLLNGEAKVGLLGAPPAIIKLAENTRSRS